MEKTHGSLYLSKTQGTDETSCTAGFLHHVNSSVRLGLHNDYYLSTSTEWTT